MYLLGHIGSAALVAYLLRKKYPELGFWLIVASSMLPDILDKPISSLLLHRGRFIAHSLLFNLSLFLVFYFAVPSKRLESISVLLGVFVHLIGDIQSDFYYAVFFPAFGIPPEIDKFAFLLGYQRPFVWITEVLGLVSLLFVGWKLSWKKREWQILGGVIVLYLVTYTIAVWLFVLN